MDKILRILILEDVPEDAELTEYELRKAGVEFISKRVDTREAFQKALNDFSPDLILSDYSLPFFDGLAAFTIAHEERPDVPFILVTGVMGEEFAIEALRKGVTDYVLKSNLTRLVPVVHRALQEASERSNLKQIEKSLQESEKLYRLLAENTSDVITRHLPDGTYLYVSPASRTLFGYEPEELIGTKAFNQMHPEDVKRIISITQEAVRNGRSHIARYRHLKKDGQYIWVETTGKVIKNERTGDIEDIICVVRDISDRKNFEDTLQKIHHQQKAILDNIPDIAWLKNKESRFIAVNEPFGKACGVKPDDLIGKSDLDIWPKELAERYRADDKEVMETRKRKQLEEPLIDKDGNKTWIETIKTPIFDSTGEVIGTTGIARDVTERKQAEESLRKEKDKAQKYLDIAKVILIAINVEQKVTLINKKGCEVLDYTEQEIIGKNWFDNFVPAGTREKVKDTFVKLMSGKVEAIEYFENPVLTKSGAERIIAWHNTILKDEAENIIGTLSSGEDITERKQAAEALCKSEAELHDNYFTQATINMILSESLENIPLEEILQKALNMILSIPWMAFEAIGCIFLVEDDADVLVMKAQSNLHEPITKLCMRVPFGKCHCGKAAQTQEIQFADHVDERHEIRYEGISPHGHYAVPILFSGKTMGVLNIYLKEGFIRDKKEEEFLRTVADTLAGIIMRKKAEERIEYLAYYDNLTGLPNRNLFIDRLTQGIARAEYSKKLVAVLTIDIDRFKSINDTYGFDTGDAVLIEVAKGLIASVRDGDTVARLGNDDFGLLLIDIAQSDDIILVVEKIMKNASQTIHFNGKEIVLTLSVGISVYPNDGKEASSLIKNADLAFAKAKQQGRKNYQFYTEGMDVKASEFVLMEKNLFNAMKNEEFILHYQPYWDISTKKITGMEALIRWKSPALGLISPGKFIPVLEDTRMIIEVGEWILRTATRQVKEWQNNGYPVVPVSVNLSLIQFRQKDLAEMVKRIMKEYGYYPSLLTLEITESAFMQDIDFTRSVLKSLKDIGISISIDDFGTGYSSLSYLKRFPIDNLKIDISFIRDIAADPDTASIVTAIIGMAHSLNLKTIAEGIETEEQWKILRLLRCDMGQGFYFSKPLPAEEIEKLFNTLTQDK